MALDYRLIWVGFILYLIYFPRIQDIERQCEDELGQLVASAGNTGLVRELQEWIRRRGSYALNPKHQLIFMAW